jgi:predicted nucleotidyltransferase
MKDKPDFIETAKKVIAQHHPHALAAFVAGSIVRGEQTSTSDIDLLVIYGDDFDDVHRASIIFDEWPVEMFVQNTKANAYFMNKDKDRGIPTMPTIVYEGIDIKGSPSFIAERKRKAKEILDAGPPALKDTETSRYMLTGLLDDIIGAAEKKVSLLGSLSMLYQELGDFYLRAHGKWSGRGKSLTRVLNKTFPELAARYETAFADAFSGKGIDGVLGIADEMLLPFGGRCFAGLRQKASDDWKNFVSEI